MKPVLVVRPEPGAGETARRAGKFGLEAIAAPIFTVGAIPWEGAPDAETVMLTSANAARLGGEALAGLLSLPCYAVGPATAKAARRAGFRDVHTGPADGAALLGMMAGDAVRRTLHLCGQDHKPLTHPAIRIDRRIVYASLPEPQLAPTALQALEGGALVLLHSPRAGVHFARLVDAAGLDRSRVALAAISDAAARAAGPGWRRVAAAAAPRDEALLELAIKLCQTGSTETAQGSADGL